MNTGSMELSAVALPNKKIIKVPVRMSDQELEYKILKLIEQKPHQTQRELAFALGISLGKTHYLIKSLIDVGFIKLDNFQKSNNKWGYIYLLTPKGIIEKSKITARFLKRKQNEYNKLRKEILDLEEEVRHQNINQNK